MRITIEINTEAMTARDEAVLAAISGGAKGRPLSDDSPASSASDAAPASTGSDGAPTVAPTTSEPRTRARRGAAKSEAAESTPASTTSPGDVFANPSASAPTAASSAPTGDVFSQQVKAANAAAAAEAPAAGGATKEQVSARVSELLGNKSINAAGLRIHLNIFTGPDGQPANNLRDLQEKDFGAFLEELAVYG